MKLKELKDVSKTSIWLSDPVISDYPINLDGYYWCYAEREIESIQAQDFQEVAGLVLFVKLKAGD